MEIRIKAITIAGACLVGLMLDQSSNAGTDGWSIYNVGRQRHGAAFGRSSYRQVVHR